MRVITGTARGITLKTPDGILTRPTSDRVKEALFSVIQFDVPCAKILDLFGGTGQLGIEALSRGAESAVFVDSQKKAAKLIQENLKRTNLDTKAKIICCDYMQYLQKCTEKYDIIFLDPPYAEKFLENALKCIGEIDILKSGGIIVTERPSGKELSCELSEYSRSRDYKYGNTLVTLYRKDNRRGEAD